MIVVFNLEIFNKKEKKIGVTVLSLHYFCFQVENNLLQNQNRYICVTYKINIVTVMYVVFMLSTYTFLVYNITMAKLSLRQTCTCGL